MKPLKLPAYSYRLKEDPGGKFIFDPVRQKYVALTPEEWVRQHFLNYLTGYLGYPKGLISVEASFRLNSMLRRADILVHDREGNPVMIVECKAPGVKLDQTVFDQIINYNFRYEVKYLVVTNGIDSYAAKCDSGKKCITGLDRIPDYETVIGKP